LAGGSRERCSRETVDAAGRRAESSARNPRTAAAPFHRRGTAPRVMVSRHTRTWSPSAPYALASSRDNLPPTGKSASLGTFGGSHIAPKAQTPWAIPTAKLRTPIAAGVGSAFVAYRRSLPSHHPLRPRFRHSLVCPSPCCSSCFWPSRWDLPSRNGRITSPSRHFYCRSQVGKTSRIA
jgi:hypothetical protein